MASRPRRGNSPAPGKANESPSRPPGKQSPIVGIGASAGGLEAFQRLLKALPIDTGMAFVLVQHLDPVHESILTRLLASATLMPVMEVKEGMAVEPNHVYVIPPNKVMSIRDGALHLAARLKAGSAHMPIDHFFRSLAESERHRAIGVILSGAASDGTLGLGAIKAEGGITLAQDEASAKYTGMPRSAAAAGCVDFILPPEGIARELTRVSRHPYVGDEAPASSLAISDEPNGDLREIFRLLRSVSGVDFAYYKYTTVKRRIARRMALHKLDHLQDYLKYLQGNRPECSALFEDILIHVTGFFREPEVFEELKSSLFRAILKNKQPANSVRIWVPGCSTGEEAYSIAMVLLEFLDNQTSAPSIQIFGTDISEEALDRARTGVYSESSVSEISPGRLQRFFVHTATGYQIVKSIREMCIFARHNLGNDPPFSRLDLVSCRNVLIYMGPALQKKIMTIFHYALKPSGYLLLGKSESVGGYAELFVAAGRKHKIYLKKATPSRPVFDLPPAELEEAVRKEQKAETPPKFDVQREADRIVVNHYAPAGLIANDSLQILHFRGQVASFLSPSPGEASLNLLRMVRPEFAVELRTAVHRAHKQQGPIRKEGILTKREGRLYDVALEVIPIQGEMKEAYYLVLFDERRCPEADGKVSGSKKLSKAQELETARLERELQSTKEYLQSIIEEQEANNEELKSANEEILSSNEELQSTNEELETAKEELQSTNEELVTVNEQMQSRNLELSQLGDDLTNLLGGVNIPIVMLGLDHRIRRFNPQAERLLNLLPTDVGRPIDNIRPNIAVPDLENRISEVIDKVTSMEREVQDLDGHWYSMRLRPYRTSDNKIDGAVMILVDIDALKKTQGALQAQTLFAEAVLQSAGALVMVTNADGEIVAFNHACELSSGYKFSEVKGKSSWDDFLVPAEEVDGVKAIYRKLLHSNGPIQHENTWKSRSGARRLISWSSAAIAGADGAPKHSVRIGADITERRAAETALQASETALRQNERKLQRLAAGLIHAHEEDRRRIARELGDQLNQKLVSLTRDVDALQHTDGSDKHKYASLRQRFSTISQEVGRLSNQLHPSSIERLGLAAALKSYCSDFQQRQGISVRLSIRSVPKKIPRNVSLGLYRVVQEALDNVAMRSGARQASVSLKSAGGMLILVVKDFGRGFDVDRVRGRGDGLIGLEQRARLMQGTFSIHTKPGEGVQLEVQVPLAQKRLRE